MFNKLNVCIICIILCYYYYYYYEPFRINYLFYFTVSSLIKMAEKNMIIENIMITNYNVLKQVNSF